MKTIILPGMGADSSMYQNDPYQKLSRVTFADWPLYNGENTIEAVAKSVINQYNIETTTIIGGSSLGGMVAVEIAKILGIKKVILIGSATSPDYVNQVLQKISRLSDITPIKLIQLFSGKANLIGKNEILSMFEQADGNFIKTMCKAIFKWKGIENYNCELCHIHGANDLVISPPKDNVKIIEDGGHLISITHSDIVAKYIELKTKNP